MQLQISGTKVHLLPEKAIYLESCQTLLVADVHLGKSETFQALGVPIPSQVNQGTLDRLYSLCVQHQPTTLIILGDLFHSNASLTPEVLEQWTTFLNRTDVTVKLIIGNHDRKVERSLSTLSIDCYPDGLQQDQFLFSHEPAPQTGFINLCGHIHPCVRIKTKLDQLRLPCFYFDKSLNLLLLPSFGEFTGGCEMVLTGDAIAYIIAEDTVIPWAGS